MRIRLCFVLATTLLVFLACAQSSNQAPSPGSDIITRAELDELGVRNLYEAIQRLRPRWLLVRGPRSFSMETEIVVFQDEAFLGNAEVLQRLGIEGIYSIRHLDGQTASASLPGMSGRHISGAIILSMRPPRPTG